MTIVSRLAAALAGLPLLAGPAIAEGASRWQQGFHSRVRLLSVRGERPRRDRDRPRQGVQDLLAPARGIRPSPAFRLGGLREPRGGRSALARAGPDGGCRRHCPYVCDRVVFPVSITAADPAKPVKLRLFMEYGVCKDICIPARAELSLVLGGGARQAAGHRRGPGPRAAEAAARRGGPACDPRRRDRAGRKADLDDPRPRARRRRSVRGGAGKLVSLDFASSTETGSRSPSRTGRRTRARHRSGSPSPAAARRSRRRSISTTACGHANRSRTFLRSFRR